MDFAKLLNSYTAAVYEARGRERPRDAELAAGACCCWAALGEAPDIAEWAERMGAFDPPAEPTNDDVLDFRLFTSDGRSLPLGAARTA